MIIEKLIQAQVALFFESRDNRPDKLINNIEAGVVGIFDQMPNIIPLPNDAPSEIPRVVMQSSDGVYTCNISNTRVDFIANYSNVDKTIDEIWGEFLIKANQFATAIFNSKNILRFGIVGQFFIQEEKAVEKIKRKYFNPEIGEVNEISLRFNEKKEYLELDVNNITEISQGFLTSPNGDEIKGVYIQKDVNNTPIMPIQLEQMISIIESGEFKYSEKNIKGLLE